MENDAADGGCRDKKTTEWETEKLERRDQIVTHICLETEIIVTRTQLDNYYGSAPEKKIDGR